MLVSHSPKCVQERAQQNFEVSMGISAHEVTLDQLANEIAEVYERCGFDRDATVSTLQMLTNIEVSTQLFWFLQCLLLVSDGTMCALQPCRHLIIYCITCGKLAC